MGYKEPRKVQKTSMEIILWGAYNKSTNEEVISILEEYWNKHEDKGVSHEIYIILREPNYSRIKITPTSHCKNKTTTILTPYLVWGECERRIFRKNIFLRYVKLIGYFWINGYNKHLQTTV